MDLVMVTLLAAFFLRESIGKANNCKMLFMCPSFCMRVKDGCYVCECGSLNGIFQQASNELNKLSGKKLSQTGSQMMSRPNGLTSITQTQMQHGVANARYQPQYSSGYNQMYNGQGKAYLGHAAGGSGQYRQNFFMPGMSCGHISSDCPSVCWQTNIYTGCITCTCGNTKKPVPKTESPSSDLSIKPKQPKSPYPLTQNIADNRMKTPSTPSFKVTPNTAPPLKVPTPPTQRTLKTSTTINVVELAPTIQTVTSTIARLNVTNAIESLLNNQSVQSKANKFQLTPSINPKYSIAVQSLSLAAGILTTPTSERNNVPNKKMTMLSLNSNISYLEHSEGKEQNTYDINPSSIKTESMTTPSRTRGVFTFPITTAVSANATNTNVQRGDQIKGFDMFPSTNSKNMNYIPSGLFLSTTGGTEVGGNIKSNANHSIHVFGLPGINDIASSDDKPILSAVTTKGPPQAVGINFDDNNMFLPDDGIHLPGLESDDRGLPIVADTDDTTAESYNEGFGLFGNVKSGIVDSAIS